MASSSKRRRGAVEANDGGSSSKKGGGKKPRLDATNLDILLRNKNQAEDMETEFVDGFCVAARGADGYDDVSCSVCMGEESEPGDVILFCDSCNIAVHQV